MEFPNKEKALSWYNSDEAKSKNCCSKEEKLLIQKVQLLSVKSQTLIKKKETK